MSAPDHEADDVQIVPIAMSRETIANLARLGRLLGKHPLLEVAPMILRDAVCGAAMAAVLELPRGAGTLN